MRRAASAPHDAHRRIVREGMEQAHIALEPGRRRCRRLRRIRAATLGATSAHRSTLHQYTRPIHRHQAATPHHMQCSASSHQPTLNRIPHSPHAKHAPAPPSTAYTRIQRPRMHARNAPQRTFGQSWPRSQCRSRSCQSRHQHPTAVNRTHSASRPSSIMHRQQLARQRSALASIAKYSSSILGINVSSHQIPIAQSAPGPE
jgi:hypothetical protein